MGNHRARAAYPLMIRRAYNPSGPKRKGGRCLCILHIPVSYTHLPGKTGLTDGGPESEDRAGRSPGNFGE